MNFRVYKHKKTFKLPFIRKIGPKVNVANALMNIIEQKESEYTEDINRTSGKSADKTLSCEKCYRTFSSQIFLSEHNKTCSFGICLLCRKHFVSASALRLHYLSQHSNNEMPIKNETNEYEFDCDRCNEIFYESLETVQDIYLKYERLLCVNCQNQAVAECVNSFTDDLFVNDYTQVNENTTAIIDRDVDLTHTSLPDVNDPTEPAHNVSEAPEPDQDKDKSWPNALAKYQSNIDHLFEVSLVQNYLKCKVCQLKALKFENMLNHTKTVHRLDELLHVPKFMFCPYCKHENSSFKKLQEHLYQNHTEVLKCEYCSSEFSTLSGKQSHILNDHPERTTYKCIHCSKIFLTMKERTLHMKWHRRRERIYCQQCNTMCKGRTNYSAHEKTHLDISDDMMCHICGTYMKTKSLLKDHLKKHKYKKRRLCEDCGKFVPNAAYNKHKVSHTKKIVVRPPRINSCKYCDKVFNTSKNLYQHKRIVHEKHLYVQCDECPSKFPFPHCLRKHKKKMHSYSQPMDDQAQNNPDVVVEEYYVHNTQGTGKSNHANLVLSSTSKGKRLRKRSTGGLYQYVCQFCSQVFKSKRRQEEHEQFHKAEHIYKCGDCGKMFTHITALNQHQALKHSARQMPTARVRGKWLPPGPSHARSSNRMVTTQEAGQHSRYSYSQQPDEEQETLVAVSNLGNIGYKRMY